MSNLTFNDLIILYKATKKEVGSFTGTIDVTDQIVLDALQKANSVENYENSGVTLDLDEKAPIILGQNYNIIFTAPRVGLGILAKNFSDLIESQISRMTEPNAYFIYDQNYAKDDPNPPADVKKYRKLLEFIGILKDCSAYFDSATSEIIFLDEGKFVIPVNYSKTNVDQIDYLSLEKLTKFFGVDIHEEQKNVILRNTVISELQISARSKRFVTLLTEIATVLSKFIDGYNLFLADFSYDKIREQFEEDKIEYTNRIHKVFSDVQNQLLSIPVATVIVATQMKVVKDGSSDFANLALLVGAWVFAVIFLLLCYNQWKTLSTISIEINKKEKKIKDDYALVNKMFENIFLSLYQRVKQQYIFLGIVAGVLVAGLISTHIFYFKIKDQNKYYESQSTILKPKNQNVKSAI